MTVSEAQELVIHISKHGLVRQRLSIVDLGVALGFSDKTRAVMVLWLKGDRHTTITDVLFDDLVAVTE